MSRTCFSTAIAMATALAAAVPAVAQTAVPAPATTAPAQPAPSTMVQPATPAGSVPVSTAAQPASAQPTAVPTAPVTPAIKPPADYVIGVDDALEIGYWQDKEMSAAVTVRPDGYISLPLLNDVKAAGLTPEELRVAVAKAATSFVEDPTVSIVVKAINSRKVFITGQVAKPGPYLLTDTTSVLQMIATAGGVAEYAKKDKITIVRRENGKEVVHKFNYKDVSKGKAMAQNITLKPGDTIVVP
jgi:polysaccharide biosynthesis/export protein